MCSCSQVGTHTHRNTWVYAGLITFAFTVCVCVLSAVTRLTTTTTNINMYDVCAASIKLWRAARSPFIPLQTRKWIVSPPYRHAALPPSQRQTQTNNNNTNISREQSRAAAEEQEHRQRCQYYLAKEHHLRAALLKSARACKQMRAYAITLGRLGERERRRVNGALSS